MKVTCTNPSVEFHVYHVDNSHYFVATFADGHKTQAHHYGDDWEFHYYCFIDAVINPYRKE